MDFFYIFFYWGEGEFDHGKGTSRGIAYSRKSLGDLHLVWKSWQSGNNLHVVKEGGGTG